MHGTINLVRDRGKFEIWRFEKERGNLIGINGNFPEDEKIVHDRERSEIQGAQDIESTVSATFKHNGNIDGFINPFLVEHKYSATIEEFFFMILVGMSQFGDIYLYRILRGNHLSTFCNPLNLKIMLLTPPPLGH